MAGICSCCGKRFRSFFVECEFCRGKGCVSCGGKGIVEVVDMCEECFRDYRENILRFFRGRSRESSGKKKKTTKSKE